MKRAQNIKDTTSNHALLELCVELCDEAPFCLLMTVTGCGGGAERGRCCSRHVMRDGGTVLPPGPCSPVPVLVLLACSASSGIGVVHARDLLCVVSAKLQQSIAA